MLSAVSVTYPLDTSIALIFPRAEIPASEILRGFVARRWNNRKSHREHYRANFETVIVAIVINKSHLRFFH